MLAKQLASDPSALRGDAAERESMLQALEEELAARNREMADLKAAAQTADVQAAAATKQAAVLEAQLASLKTQASESQRLSEEAAAGQGQASEQAAALEVQAWSLYPGGDSAEIRDVTDGLGPEIAAIAATTFRSAPTRPNVE